MSVGNIPARVPQVAPETRTEDLRTEDLNIVLLFGCTGTGKTSFANIASGSNMEVGRGLQSSTKHLEASKIFQVDGQRVMVVDCPGFNDTHLTETEILRRLAEFLVQAYERKDKIAGLLYFHKISDTRVGGTSFRHMNMFKALCGTGAFTNVVYVTNIWSEPPTEDEVLREQELRDTDEFFGMPLASGAQMARHNNTHDSALSIIRMILGKGCAATNLQRQLVEEKMPLEATDVGLVIGHDLEDDLSKQQQEREELMADKVKALEANDQVWLQRLEAQEERTRKREQQLINQLRTLKASKPKQSETTSQQIRAARTQAMNAQVSALKAQIEAKTNELIQNTKRHDDRLDTFSPNQQEWSRRRNEQTADEVARIRATTARARHEAADRKTLNRVATGLLTCTYPVLAVGVGVYNFISDVDLMDRSRALPYPPHVPTIAPWGSSYMRPQPISGPVPENVGHRLGRNNSGTQSYRPSVHRGKHNEPARPVPARVSSQFRETSRAPGQLYQPPRY